MQSMISLDKLTKTFGTSRGVTELELEVTEGAIVGFLGPNGAGKSTTMNMLMGYIKPTRGSAKIFDKDIVHEGVAIRKDIGFLASDMALDGGLTGWQQLEYFGRLRHDYDKSYVHELAKRLDANLTRKIKTLSRGNRQKIALIATLMHKPKLLLLDEPTSGLDPLIQSEFNKIILEHKAAGRTTFISSHVLSEIQELCDRMIFIREGKIIANTTFAELTKTAPKNVKLTSEDTALASALKLLKGVSNIRIHDKHITFSFSGDSSALVSLLAKHQLSDLVIEETDLEGMFMEYYENESEAAHA